MNKYEPSNNQTPPAPLLCVAKSEQGDLQSKVPPPLVWRSPQAGHYLSHGQVAPHRPVFSPPPQDNRVKWPPSDCNESVFFEKFSRLSIKKVNWTASMWMGLLYEWNPHFQNDQLALARILWLTLGRQDPPHFQSKKMLLGTKVAFFASFTSFAVGLRVEKTSQFPMLMPQVSHFDHLFSKHTNLCRLLILLFLQGNTSSSLWDGWHTPIIRWKI